MPRYAFLMRLSGEDAISEYERKHAEIGADIREAHRRAGLRNYSIHRAGIDLFGYFETEEPQQSLMRLTNDPVMKPWFEWAEPLMEFDERGKPRFVELKEVFHME